MGIKIGIELLKQASKKLPGGKGKNAEFLSKRIKLGGGKTLPRSKEFEKFELEMDKYLGQTVAKKRKKSVFKKVMDTLPGKGVNKLIMPAAVVAVSAAEPNKKFFMNKKNNKAKPKRKEDKVSKANIIGKGSPKGRAHGGFAVKGQGAAVRGNNFKGVF